MTDADDASRRLWMSLGLAAVGTVGAYRGAQEVLTQQARIARRVIPKPTSRPYSGDGLYRPGARSPEPWRPGMTCDVHMMIFGDSLAAGLGADSPDELPGVLLARGLAEESGWDVRLSIKAIVGATSKGLPGQIEAMQIAHGDPDISVILVGGNDITSRNAIGPSARRVGDAVRALRENGSHVVVGTCPDLSIIKPVPQPLRSVMSGLSRRLAGAQAVQARKAGGIPVSLAETLAPEFHRRGESLFSPDRFHPNSAGYELAAGLLLPAVCVALGVWEDMPEEQLPHDAEEAAASLEAAESAADLAVSGSSGETADTGATVGTGAPAETADTGAPVEHRESVVARLTKRLTDFVRTHEDADDGDRNTFLHNEDVDGDPESTGEAREAADTLRRRSRILTPTRSTRDDPDPQD